MTLLPSLCLFCSGVGHFGLQADMLCISHKCTNIHPLSTLAVHFSSQPCRKSGSSTHSVGVENLSLLSSIIYQQTDIYSLVFVSIMHSVFFKCTVIRWKHTVMSGITRWGFYTQSAKLLFFLVSACASFGSGEDVLQSCFQLFMHLQRQLRKQDC